MSTVAFFDSIMVSDVFSNGAIMVSHVSNGAILVSHIFNNGALLY